MQGETSGYRWVYGRVALIRIRVRVRFGFESCSWSGLVSLGRQTTIVAVLSLHDFIGRFLGLRVRDRKYGGRKMDGMRETGRREGRGEGYEGKKGEKVEGGEKGENVEGGEKGIRRRRGYGGEGDTEEKGIRRRETFPVLPGAWGASRGA